MVRPVPHRLDPGVAEVLLGVRPIVHPLQAVWTVARIDTARRCFRGDASTVYRQIAESVRLCRRHVHLADVDPLCVSGYLLEHAARLTRVINGETPLVNQILTLSRTLEAYRSDILWSIDIVDPELLCEQLWVTGLACRLRAKGQDRGRAQRILFTGLTRRRRRRYEGLLL